MSELRFDQLPLAAPLQRALDEKGYTQPSPIQAQAIPVLLEGRDLLACAQTGTGKTAAFALPLLDRMAGRPRRTFRRGVRHLVLVPTRELAGQVADSFKVYGRYVDFRLGMVYGGVSERPQIKELFTGLDVLVATTGRLLDLMGQGHVDLGQVESLVLDEADRMLDMGFINDIRRIVRALPAERQNLLFSATMAPAITELAGSILRNPKEIRIAPQGTTAEKVDQRMYFIRPEHKLDLLVETLKHRRSDNADELSLIFCKTKHGSNKLAKKLEQQGIAAEAIHGNKSQAARERSLAKFRSGALKVLVATDVAARGIDVKRITLVVNFDLPMEAESYVHRIGRTARAGESGRAISFCSTEEVALLREVERLIRTAVPVDSAHAYHAQEALDLHRSGRPVKKPPQGGGGRGGRGPGGPGGGPRRGGRRPARGARARPAGRR